MRDPARGALRRHAVAVLEPAEVVPEPDAAAEQDRDDGDVEPVDEPGLEELAHDGRAAADPHVLAARRLQREVERLAGRRGQEVEGRVARHLENRARAVGEHEHRDMERRLVAPPAAPVRIVRGGVEPEHAGPHDLRPDLGEVRLRVLVVDAGRPLAGRLVQHSGPERAGRDVGLDQARPVVPERVLACLVGRRRETVQGDVQVDTHGHRGPPR